MSKKLYFLKASQSLEKVVYEFYEDQMGDDSLTVTAVDSYQIVDIQKTRIELLITRDFRSIPKGIVHMSVSTRTILELDPEKEFEGSLEEMREYFDSKAADIIQNSETLSTISLVIASLTSAYGRVPIISPPYYLSEETKDEDVNVE